MNFIPTNTDYYCSEEDFLLNFEQSTPFPTDLDLNILTPLPQESPISEQSMQIVVNSSIQENNLAVLVEKLNKVSIEALTIDLRNQNIKYSTFSKLVQLFPHIQQLIFNNSSIAPSYIHGTPLITIEGKSYTTLEAALISSVFYLGNLKSLQGENVVISKTALEKIWKLNTHNTHISGIGSKKVDTTAQLQIKNPPLYLSGLKTDSDNFKNLIKSNRSAENITLDNLQGVPVDTLKELKLCTQLRKLSVIGLFDKASQEDKLSFINEIIVSCPQIEQIRFSTTQQLTGNTLKELRDVLKISVVSTTPTKKKRKLNNDESS